jgi:cytochrome P450
MSLRDILHDEAIFPEPLKFMPERWLDASGKLDKNKDRFYVPFGRGHRMCLGHR